MATLSTRKLNIARHRQGWFAHQESEERKRRLEEQKNRKPVSKEEHKRRVEMLKKIGLLKENE
ncbi:MAG: hypothetical protein IB618_00825 [Candidatus Pacearchaeota archaeon]|nr:MAG: hypothetical protein IB618_00825 [Candidatus Pacearchaeota archaeon]